MLLGKPSELILLSLLLMFVAGCSLCGESTGTQTTSPDQMLSAITTYRDCGATTSEYTSVSLKPTPSNHSDIEEVVFTARYRHVLALEWSSPTALIVRCSTCSQKDIELQIVKFRRVQISYEFGGRVALQSR